jgi:hypothetical protein
MNLDISYYFHEGENMTKNTSRYPQRVRNELRFRELTVLRVERISAAFSALYWAVTLWTVLAHTALTTIPRSFS